MNSHALKLLTATYNNACFTLLYDEEEESSQAKVQSSVAQGIIKN
jgi:hypothetical protein